MKQRVRNFTCAYYGGKGRDPFGLFSPMAVCQVCGGRGRVVFAVTEERIVACRFCHGKGRHPFTRMSCTVCLGKGMILVDEKATQCPSCQGTGSAPGKGMPCSACGGRGTKEPARRRRLVAMR